MWITRSKQSETNLLFIFIPTPKEATAFHGLDQIEPSTQVISFHKVFSIPVLRFKGGRVSKSKHIENDD